MAKRPPLFWILAALGVLSIAYGALHQLNHMDHLSKTLVVTVFVGVGLLVWASRQRPQDAT
jgi:protein-S-isoprenylcysteine O-methyltransferase Ste14